MCSQDVMSLGSIQGTSSLHQALIREPTYSPRAEGLRTPLVNWISMVTGTHFLSLTWKEGQCVLNTLVAQDLFLHQPSPPLPSYSPQGHSKATWMNHVHLLGNHLQNHPDSVGLSSSAHAAQHCVGLSRGTHHG